MSAFDVQAVEPGKAERPTLELHSSSTGDKNGASTVQAQDQVRSTAWSVDELQSIHPQHHMEQTLSITSPQTATTANFPHQPPNSPEGSLTTSTLLNRLAISPDFARPSFAATLEQLSNPTEGKEPEGVGSFHQKS